MFAEMPVASFYLMIVGGLATALGLPLLLAADRADLPAAIFAWGCAAYAVAFLLFTGTLAVRAIGMPIGAALVGAVLLAGLSSMPAAARHHDIPALSLQRPPSFGVRLAAMLGQLADDPRYAAN